MSQSETRILLAGISGMLGGKIADALLVRSPEIRVRALVRNAAAKRAELTAFLERGVELVDGDVTQPTTLDAAMDGVTAVISALNNDPSLIVDGQTNLLRAAERAGTVRRFIPSDFSVDYRKLDLGDNANLDMRKRFLPILQASPVPHTLVLQGAFTEMLRTPFFSPYDAPSNAFRYWGDGLQPMDFTTVADTALYVAATVLDPRTANQALHIAGDQVTYLEIADAFDATLGKPVRRESLGSTDDLRRWIETRKASAQNAWEYLGQQYQWAMVTGKAKLHPIHNGWYPEIRPVSVREFLAAG